MTRRSPFHYCKTSPEIIRLVVMLFIRFPLYLRNVEYLLHERGIEGMESSHWRRHLDEVFVKINDVRYYLRRAVDHRRRGPRKLCHEDRR